ncbi:SDR family NAD(P)-dependent oxidoreductase [Curtobacterium sp. MCBA15_013]|uniref:SDR family NAD(P)-dependent oxidoreductase n=1 Tax=Curtobacterium sp. MCBA15_013 TaxID=1898739 RepID=UPI0008DE9AC4|nr:glucose 1-dehydrogenase [Curtobacterium sp. MCBA15_013]OII25176.1 short-chain dehydrogenase [Curtobacterium sp. MCBA15_013]
MARLSDKVAIITGAASGMGLAGAQLFAAEGATVIMTDVSEDALQREAAAIRDTGGSVTAHTLDVTSPESWASVVERTVSDHGRIDVLVNNAGIHMAKGILEAELDDWNTVMAVNTTGVWLGMKSVIPHMQRQGSGSIVNVSSIAAIVGGVSDAGGAAYSASKGAVRSLTKHAAQWFGGDGIRVNSIHPGSVYTGLAVAAGMSKEDMASQLGGEIPLPPHIGEPTDIGYGMLYLASDEAKYVTGEELVIDGGWTTH